jgi:hypothetical protein
MPVASCAAMAYTTGIGWYGSRSRQKLVTATQATSFGRNWKIALANGALMIGEICYAIGIANLKSDFLGPCLSVDGPTTSISLHGPSKTRFCQSIFRHYSRAISTTFAMKSLKQLRMILRRLAGSCPGDTQEVLHGSKIF